jgi:hypothetical protein
MKKTGLLLLPQPWRQPSEPVRRIQPTLRHFRQCADRALSDTYLRGLVLRAALSAKNVFRTQNT